MKTFLSNNFISTIRNIIFIITLCILSHPSFANQDNISKNRNLVYKVDIKEEIGPKIWRNIKKSFDEADRLDVNCILIDMNTYGGMVVYADSIRTLILEQTKPVFVYINNNAASAGAMISIACDKIYMREGANIGAATVVNQSGEAMPDKYQSYMRSMIRATAQSHGKDTIVENGITSYRWKRDPMIAEAMVDQDLYIKNVSDSGRVVTFTPHEAIQNGYCDGIANSVAEVLQKENINNYSIISYKTTFSDDVIGVLINPIIKGILIMLIFGGIYFELQSPGVGFPLAIALSACLLYFAPLYIEGFASNWEIIIFAIGIILILLEVFVVPGFGITGISGILCVLGSLIFAGIDSFSWRYVSDFSGVILSSLIVVLISSTVAIVLSIWLGAKLISSKKFAFALHSEQKVNDGYISVNMDNIKLIGKKGVAYSDLRPAGKVIVDNKIYDAIALNGKYITKNSEVEVKEYHSGQIYVV